MPCDTRLLRDDLQPRDGGGGEGLPLTVTESRASPSGVARHSRAMIGRMQRRRRDRPASGSRTRRCGSPPRRGGGIPVPSTRRREEWTMGRISPGEMAATPVVYSPGCWGSRSRSASGSTARGPLPPAGGFCVNGRPQDSMRVRYPAEIRFQHLREESGEAPPGDRAGDDRAGPPDVRRCIRGNAQRPSGFWPRSPGRKAYRARQSPAGPRGENISRQSRVRGDPERVCINGDREEGCDSRDSNPG